MIADYAYYKTVEKRAQETTTEQDMPQATSQKTRSE
jgi:hypothetical protein